MSGSLCEARRPRLLDLFCGAGGASKGYHDAGFEVVGVDHKPQPRYPYEFILGDALDALDYCTFGRGEFGRNEFQAIHASPPCQLYSVSTVMHDRSRHVDLVGPVRDRLRAVGLPYVIENVPGAPLENAVQVCGSGLGIVRLRRHRLFGGGSV